jgi:signal transduction histidine kinase
LEEIKSKKSDSAEQVAGERAEKCLERRNMTFDAIFRLLEKIGTTMEVKKIVQLFLMTLMGQLGLKRTVCYLVHPERKLLRGFYSLGVAEKDSLASFDMGGAFVRWLESLEEPVHIDVYFNRSRDNANKEEAAVATLVDRGFAYAYPLRDQEGMGGAVFYSAKITGEGFDEFENELLKMLAGVATITIKNAWLYQVTLLSKLELEKFAEVKKEFINHTSHELRTPLTVLKSALWSIEPGEVDDNIMVDMAKDALQSLQKVVDYLLSLNEIELNKTDLRMMPTDVSSVIEDCLREMLPELEEKAVKVSVDDQVRFKNVMVDPSKLKIVLRNMLDNALDSVGEGGNILVETALSDDDPGREEGVEIGDWYLSFEERFGGGIFVDTDRESPLFGQRDDHPPFRRSREESYLVIRIRDDGIGIPPDEIKSLAEPFRRATNSILKNVKGLGIGLSVSQKIVAGHGGKIFCRSGEGKGAQFSIWIPLTEPEYTDEP